MDESVMTALRVVDQLNELARRTTNGFWHKDRFSPRWNTHKDSCIVYNDDYEVFLVNPTDDDPDPWDTYSRYLTDLAGINVSAKATFRTPDGKDLSSPRIVVSFANGTQGTIFVENGRWYFP